MKKTDLIISITAGIILAVVAMVFGMTNTLLHQKPVNAAQGTEDPLTLILNSHTKWGTLKGQAQFVWYSEDGGVQTYVNSFQVVQPDKVYVDVINIEGKGNDGVWISDGTNTYDVNKETKTYTQGKIPAFARDLSKMPTTLLEAKNTEAIYMHPFSALIVPPVRAYIYPEWFSQGDGSYELLGEDVLIGRKVWVIELRRGTDVDKAWIDQETGIIIQFNQQTNGKPFLDVKFTKLEVNGPVNNSVFSVPGGYTQSDK